MHWMLVLVVCAQSAAPAAPVATPEANLPALKIGANDLVAVSVYGAPELSRSVRVSGEGQIRLPMLERRIGAEGLQPSELEAAIAEALSAERILVNPVVTVTIVEYHSRPISVAGAVRRPVTFQAVGPITLLDALTRAEGLGPTAGAEILVTRRQPGPDGSPIALVQRIPVRGLIDAAEPELNLRLGGGEEIRVPEAGRIFVVGNVKKPGAYPVLDASDTTVMKMLAHSEGLLPHTDQTAYIYRQEAAGGPKHQIPIPLRRILDRKAADVPLEANDILYVPDNRRSRAGLSMLEKALAFATTTASGVLIWGAAR